MKPPSSYEEILIHCKKVSRGIIMIDGAPRAGKTTLSEPICADIPCHHVKIDQYITTKGVGWDVKHIDIADVAAQIAANPLVIIDSVCGFEVCSALGADPELMIWVRKLSPSGIDHFHSHPADSLSGLADKHPEVGFDLIFERREVDG